MLITSFMGLVGALHLRARLLWVHDKRALSSKFPLRAVIVGSHLWFERDGICICGPRCLPEFSTTSEPAALTRSSPALIPVAVGSCRTLSISFQMRTRQKMVLG